MNLTTVLSVPFVLIAMALIGRMGDPKSPFPVGIIVRGIHALGHAAVTLFKLLLGERGFGYARGAWNYIIFTANPILMLIYSFVVYGGFTVYFIQGIQWLPADSLHRPLSHLLLFVCFASFYIASDSDPGYLSEENIDEHSGRYPYDNCLFFPGKNCPTCNITKLARSKHCALCNRCVARFDHHCVWINNCVGAKNYKWFLLFVLTHLALTWYGPVIMFNVLAGILQQSKFWTQAFPDPITGIRKSPTLWDANRFLAQNYMLLWALTGLLCVMGIFLVLFFSYHLFGVLGNTTTNERNKRSQLQNWIDRTETQQRKEVAEKTQQTKMKATVAEENPPPPVAGTCWPDVNAMVTTGASFEEVVPQSRIASRKSVLTIDSTDSMDSRSPARNPDQLTQADLEKKPLDAPSMSSDESKASEAMIGPIIKQTTTAQGTMPKSSPLVQTSPDPDLASPNSWPLPYWKHAIEQNIYDRAQVQFGIHKDALKETNTTTRNVLVVQSELDSLTGSWLNALEVLGLYEVKKLFNEPVRHPDSTTDADVTTQVKQTAGKSKSE